MLGCFAKDVEECPLLPTANATQFSPSKAFLSIDSEFEALQHPATPLTSSSIVYAASEVFRYLRDMALGVTSTQSRPLLTPPSGKRVERPSRRNQSGYLVHPGAVLCMLDLLPCLEYDLIVDQNKPAETVDVRSSEGEGEGEGEDVVKMELNEEEEMSDQQLREVWHTSYVYTHTHSLTHVHTYSSRSGVCTYKIVCYGRYILWLVQNVTNSPSVRWVRALCGCHGNTVSITPAQFRLDCQAGYCGDVGMPLLTSLIPFTRDWNEPLRNCHIRHSHRVTLGMSACLSVGVMLN